MRARASPDHLLLLCANQAGALRPRLDSQEVALSPEARPPLGRSGACAVPLPGRRALLLGGYTEEPTKQRQPTNEAYAFSVASKAWTPLAYAAGPTPGASHRLL